MKSTGGILGLPEEVEARAVLPLELGHTDLGRRNPAPTVAAVGCPAHTCTRIYMNTDPYTLF